MSHSSSLTIPLVKRYTFSAPAANPQLSRDEQSFAFYIYFFSFNILIFRDTHNYDHTFRTYRVCRHSMKDFLSN